MTSPYCTLCDCSVVSNSCNPMDCGPLGSSAVEFSSQEHRSGLPFPAPGDLPNLGVEPVPLASAALAGGFFTPAAPGKSMLCTVIVAQSLNHVRLFATSRTATYQALLSSTISRNLLRFMSIELMMLTISSSAVHYIPRNL